MSNLPDAEDPQRGVFARRGGREGLEGNFVCGSFAEASDGFCHAAPFEAHDQLKKRTPFTQPEVVPKPLVVADAEAGGALLAQRRGTCRGWRFRGGGCSPRRRRYSRMPMQSGVVLMAIGFLMGTIRCSAASTSLSRNSTRPPILWGTDPPAVHPVVERHERDTQAAGRLAAGQIVRRLGGGFGVELPQLVAQRFANHLRELVGGHAAQKDFLWS